MKEKHKDIQNKDGKDISEDTHVYVDGRKSNAEHMHDKSANVAVKAEKNSKSKYKNSHDVNTVADITKKLELAEKEKNEHREKLLRVAAEFENFKKRMIREKQELARYSNEKLISDMLSALDDLDRVLDHISPDSSNDVKKIAEGVELVKKSLLSTLKKYNLNEIEALKQKFDPSIHEAIAIVESGASKPGTVISVHRKGYRLHDRLLRPAMVTVAKED